MQIVQLQQKIGTSDDKVQRLETSEQRLKDRVRQLEKSLEVLHHCQGKEGCNEICLHVCQHLSRSPAIPGSIGTIVQAKRVGGRPCLHNGFQQTSKS